ncbi:MAG: CHAT domain-containing tetratricopeptide repeat protein, partial [Fulvivirga sp.]|nr:CHAT domain-containing tetratricopeptide repeat protein [Fulvivirga sp.]
NYAISVNDNADFLETENFREQSVKWMSNLVNSEEKSEKEKARTMVDLGEFAYAKGHYKKAGTLFRTAKLRYETNNLTKTPEYYKLLANMGLLYSTMGRYSKAETYTIDALVRRRARFGPDHPSYGASLNNLAVLQKETGKYNESEQNIKEAVEVLRKSEDTRGMPLAIALNNQAMLYQEMGRYEQAEEILQESIDIAEEFQGEKSGNHQKFLTNMALLEQERGNYDKAEELFNELITLKKRRLGTNSPDYAHMLSNLAALYVDMGKYDQVEEKLQEAMKIYEKKYGNDHRLYAKAISDLGNFYRFEGKYEEARPLLVNAKSIREKQLGEEHPEYVQSLEDLAILHWKTGEIDKAELLYHEALAKSLAFIHSYFPPMSEAEKTKYWDKLRPRFERFYAFTINLGHAHSQLLGEMYDYHIATKGLLLQSTNKIKQKILQSDDQNLIDQYLQWLDQKEMLAAYYTYSKEELDEQDVNLDSLERAANENEKALSAKSSLFNEGYKLKQIHYRQVRDALRPGEAAVEIVRVRKFDNLLTNQVHYAALVLKPEYDKPKLTLIDNGNELEKKYFKYYNNAIHQRMADNYSYDQYWAPMSAVLAGSSTLHLSVDGIYNQVNPNTFLTPSGSYVIDQYNISFVENTKELVQQEKQSTVAKTAYLIGSPDFGGSAVTPLPGTKEEIQNISQVLAGNGYNLYKKTDLEATEKALKSVQSPKVLHIATHGYFLEDHQLSKGKVFGVSSESARDNPLLRSGLLLAGAAKVLDEERSAAMESSDNGILTAYEAMNLSLGSTDLVVLSACETGVGDVKAGEGVYGLQRAFLSAGADALIMSLWKVDDAATQALMTKFYRNWLKLGDKEKAFKKAQVELKSQYKEPYYWGAFVLIGD